MGVEVLVIGSRDGCLLGVGGSGEAMETVEII